MQKCSTLYVIISLTLREKEKNHWALIWNKSCFTVHSLCFKLRGLRTQSRCRKYIHCFSGCDLKPAQHQVDLRRCSEVEQTRRPLHRRSTGFWKETEEAQKPSELLQRARGQLRETKQMFVFAAGWEYKYLLLHIASNFRRWLRWTTSLMLKCRIQRGLTLGELITAERKLCVCVCVCVCERERHFSCIILFSWCQSWASLPYCSSVYHQSSWIIDILFIFK